jgi:poly-gamma-glutamate synthesis protein (capsule biosynthesis protein)
VLTIFLGGDLMTGRGVDQILAHPGDPRLWEVATHDARSYVRLAEAVNGPIPYPVDDGWPWGDALRALDLYGAQLRVANLETSITTNDDPAPGKGVHYRMAPANVGCLTVAGLDAVTLANNHVLDFGRPGLTETLDRLAAAGIAGCGAGRTAPEAARPAIVPTDQGGRVLLFSLGSPSSGVPPQWTATAQTPGVRLFDEQSSSGLDEVLDQVSAVRVPGDVVVVSVHWGSNWGYDVAPAQVAAARRLVDGGVDIVHGHSSHHPRPVEIYRGRLILYGVGDLIDDYEGIDGYERYRPDLRLLPLVSVDATGELVALRLVPMQAHRLSLCRVDGDTAAYLCRRLGEISHIGFVRNDDGALELARSQISTEEPTAIRS